MVQDEQTYLLAAQQGDVNAFNHLVLGYQDRVYNLTYRIMNDPASAEDLAQEAFITAFRKLDQFQGGNFGAWLLRIATNLCYDELRRRKRRPADSLEDSEVDEDADARLVSNDPPPEAQAERAALASAIEDCFSQLPDEYRLVVILSDVQEYAYEEIASTVNISVGTVKSRISRARARLRDCLRQKGELLPARFRQEDS
ncbi:MAG: sigma-70 family RNA polymerase sigma factor [Anaerolineae bacterium]|nr:sigma-70 family RNA polymerase sigma factor [Anaerolineae bacterium]